MLHQKDLYSIVRQFDDPRIRYFKNDKNCGAENVVDNWNICLSNAVGDYFVLMGDDDEMMPDYLSSFNNLIIEFPDLGYSTVDHTLLMIILEVIRLTPSWPKRESVYESIWHRMNKLRSQYISDFVYRRESLVSRGGFYKLPVAWASDDISFLKRLQAKDLLIYNILFSATENLI